MTLSSLSVSYPDFKLLDVMDPEQFDINNNEIVTRVNEIRNVVNLLTDGATGAAQISLNQVSPFISTKLQSFLQEMVTRLQATAAGVSGSDFVGTPPITGLTGTTIASQLNSLKTLLDAVNADLQTDKTALATHKTSGDHDARYTQLTGNHQGTWLGLTPSQAADATINGARLDVIEGNNHLAKTAQSLTGGMQVINSTSKGNVPFNVLSFAGRTLMNLIGRDGNGESTSNWTTSSSTLALDTANAISGSNAFRITLSNTIGYIYDRNFSVYQNHYYIMLADVKCGTAAKVYVQESNGVAGNIVTSANYSLSYVKFNPNIDMVNNVKIIVEGISGQTAFGDNIRVYEISLAEYNAIGTMTAAQVAAKYPYVDDLKNTNAVYVAKYGENLFPNMVEGTLNANASVTVTGPNTLTLVATASDQPSTFRMPIMAGQQYTLSFGSLGGGRYSIDQTTKSGANITISSWLTSNSFTFITSTDVVELVVRLGNGAAGTFVFDKPMLNLGATALTTFKPRRDQSIYIPNVQAASSVDGSIADIVSSDSEGRLRITRRFKTMDVDGSLPHTLSNDYVGFKLINCGNLFSPWLNFVGTVIKYDGKILKNNGSSNTMTAADQALIWSDSALYISIADTESGWGETYTPSAAEIQAYFYGWKMTQQEAGNTGAVYPGTGTKQWVWVTTYTNATNTLPTTFAPSSSSYKPYRLQYQLSASVDEFVETEGAVTLHEGANQVEMSTGIVVRERANPSTDPSYGIINNTSYPSSFMKNRVAKFLGIYKNRNLEYWIIQNRAGTFSNGLQDTIIPINRFDPSAVYEVTYLALDAYTLGIAPQSISGEYTPNIRETVDELAKRSADTIHRVTVLERSTPNKARSQWIAPALLNGWLNVGGTQAAIAFRKDDFGNVYIKGLIRSGTMTPGTVIFYLPLGYLPQEILLKEATSNGAGAAAGSIQIRPDSGVYTDIVTNNGWLNLNDIVFSIY